MQRLFRRSSPIFLSGLLALFGAAACGDDDGGGDGTTDSPGDDDGSDGADDDDGSDGADDDDGGPDADVPEIVRQGTVAITETSVTNTAGAVSGAVVSISYVDLESVTVPPVEGLENGIGFCAVTVYDVAAGDAEPNLVDEGPITVTGTANGDFVCGFNADQGYLCQSTDPESAGGAVGNAAGAGWDGDLAQQRAQISPLSVAVNPPALIGSQMLLDGFGDKLIDGNTFGVIDSPLNNSVVLATVGEVPDTIQTLPKTATFTTFIGAGPIRNDEGYNFITDASEVAVSAEASESGLVPAFSGTYTPEGEGFELVSDPDAGNFLPHEIPTAEAADVNFACAADGCGVDGAGGTTGAMIINGRTTDGALPPADQDPAGIAMPDPVASYATFTCAFPAADTATIRAEEVAAILGTSPTRIQTTVLRAQATLNATGGSETAETRVIIGHSQTGFTTVEAPPKLARPTK